MFVAEGVELMNEALGMNPAEGMLADPELSGIVADDDGVRDVAMRLDAAPHYGKLTNVSPQEISTCYGAQTRSSAEKSLAGTAGARREGGEHEQD
jgi:hypothetical protein